MPTLKRLVLVTGLAAGGVGLLHGLAACSTAAPVADSGADVSVPDAGSDATSDVVNIPDATPDAAGLDADADAGDPIKQFFTTAIDTYCQRFATCCSLSAAKFDLDHCRAAISAGGVGGALGGMVQLPDYAKLSYNASAAQSCLTKLAAVTCTTVPVAEWVDTFRTTCPNAVLGTVASGGTCRKSIECVAGQFCEPGAGDAGTGTCKALRTVGAVCGDLGVDKNGFANEAAHDSCSARSLGPGFCDDTAGGAAGTWKCGAAAADGASCFYDFQCQSLICGGAAGTCGQPKDLSGACSAFTKADAGP
jgi:hypothetical protein